MSATRETGTHHLQAHRCSSSSSGGGGSSTTGSDHESNTARAVLQAADGEDDAFVKLEPPCPDWQRYASANSGPFVPGENAICFEAYTTAGIGNLLTDLMGLLRLVWIMRARLLIGTADHLSLIHI